MENFLRFGQSLEIVGPGAPSLARTVARPWQLGVPGWHWTARCGWAVSPRAGSRVVPNAVAANHTVIKPNRWAQ